jgi:hypothetical protein
MTRPPTAGGPTYGGSSPANYERYFVPPIGRSPLP